MALYRSTGLGTKGFKAGQESKKENINVLGEGRKLNMCIVSLEKNHLVVWHLILTSPSQTHVSSP